MKISYVYGPKQGLNEHINPHDGNLLINAGFAVEIPATRADLSPPQPNIETWKVQRLTTIEGPETGPLAILRLIDGKPQGIYTGNPAHVNARVEWDGGGRFTSGLGVEVPGNLAATYHKIWNANPAWRNGFDAVAEAQATAGQKREAAGAQQKAEQDWVLEQLRKQ